MSYLYASPMTVELEEFVSLLVFYNNPGCSLTTFCEPVTVMSPVYSFSLSTSWSQLLVLTLWRLTTLIGGRTAPLTSKRFILYIYSTNIGTEYFKHGIYPPFFPPLQNTFCFIILTYLVPVLFTFYIQGVPKLNKNSGAKRLMWPYVDCCIIESALTRCVHVNSTYFFPVLWHSTFRQQTTLRATHSSNNVFFV